MAQMLSPRNRCNSPTMAQFVVNCQSNAKQVSNAKTVAGSESKTKFYFWKMEALSGLVKVTLPNYLSNLPIPDSFTGWFKLGSK